MCRSRLDEIDDLPRLAPTPMTRVLEQLMSDLSESCWCAGWLTECEVEIWELLAGRRQKGWGMEDRAGIHDDLVQIAAMAVLAGAWIVWGPNDPDPSPVDLQAWMAVLAS